MPFSDAGGGCTEEGTAAPSGLLEAVTATGHWAGVRGEEQLWRGRESVSGKGERIFNTQVW